MIFYNFISYLDKLAYNMTSFLSTNKNILHVFYLNKNCNKTILIQGILNFEIVTCLKIVYTQLTETYIYIYYLSISICQILQASLG